MTEATSGPHALTLIGKVDFEDRCCLPGRTIASDTMENTLGRIRKGAMGGTPTNGQSTLRDMRQEIRSYPLSVLAPGVLLQTLLEPVLSSQDGEADQFERVD